MINGIVQGVQLHNQIQRTQDEHDAMQRTALQQARENRIEDIMQQAISRPVQNGTVTEQSATPNVELGGVSIPMQPMRYTRPADKSRTVTYKDPDGNAYQREIMTKDEQHAQQLALARQGQTDVSGILQRILGQATGQGDSSGINADGSLVAPPGSTGPQAPSQNMFPGGVYVNPTQIPGILGDYVRGRDNERTNETRETIAGRVKPTSTFTNDEGNKVQVFSDGSTQVLGKAAAAPVKPVKTVQDDQGVWNVMYSDGSYKPTFQGSVKAVGRTGAGGGGGAAASGLSPDALESAANGVASGLPLSRVWPGMGNAVAEQRKQIFNRAVEIHPGLDLASAQSGFKADTGSLDALQKSRDQVAAFENTAGKNLDAFLSSAKKAVDTGSPIINRPVRSLSLLATGDPALTDMNTARQVAVTEVAKVLSNPGLSGQLSDSARHEVQELIRPDATLQQQYTAAARLRGDMKNRADSMDQQIRDLKGQIGKGGQNNAPAKSTLRFNPATMQAEPVTP